MGAEMLSSFGNLSLLEEKKKKRHCKVAGKHEKCFMKKHKRKPEESVFSLGH